MSVPVNVAQGAARQYASLLLGGPISEQDSNPSIGTSAGIVVDGNGDRVGLVIVNLSTNILYISLDSGVSSTNGIELAPSGGSVSMDVTRDFTLPSRRWYGLAGGASSSVYVLEVFRVSLPTG